MRSARAGKSCASSPDARACIDQGELNMSRVANRIIDVPSGVTVSVAAGNVTVKGAKGALTMALGPGVSVQQQDKKLSVKYEGTGQARLTRGPRPAHQGDSK